MTMALGNERIKIPPGPRSFVVTPSFRVKELSPIAINLEF
jgi:hypothetical protein